MRKNKIGIIFSSIAFIVSSSVFAMQTDNGKIELSENDFEIASSPSYSLKVAPRENSVFARPLEEDQFQFIFCSKPLQKNGGFDECQLMRQGTSYSLNDIYTTLLDLSSYTTYTLAKDLVSGGTEFWADAISPSNGAPNARVFSRSAHAMEMLISLRKKEPIAKTEQSIISHLLESFDYLLYRSDALRD